MWQRATSGLVFVLIMVLSIWWHPVAAAILFGAFVVLATAEYVNMWQRKTNISLASSLLQQVGIYLLIVLYALGLASWQIVLLLPLLMLMPLLFNLYQSKPLQTIALQSMAVFYIAIPFALFSVVANTYANYKEGAKLLLMFFVIVWLSDTFAYLWGVVLGKTPLFPSISPKKTWEGSIGGGLSAVVLTVLIAHWVLNAIWWQWIGIALIVVVSAAFGDLVESQLKRQIGVKDSGNIMPGHGGVLDRFDAALFAIPFYLLSLLLIA